MTTDYDKYAPFLGIAYEAGENDCYSLAQNYYKAVYGLDLPDYARPEDFAYTGLDLIYRFMTDDGFSVVETSLNKLERGDAILMRIGRSTVINHIGVYVGNNEFIHHAFNKPSMQEDYGGAWRQRTLTVLRHPDVTDINKVPGETASMLDLLPDHIKVRHGFPL